MPCCLHCLSSLFSLLLLPFAERRGQNEMLWEITTFTKRCFSMHLHRLPACGSHATSVWKPSYQRVVAMLPTTGSSTTSSVVRLRVRANALPNDAVRTLLLVYKSARSSVCLRHLPCCGIAFMRKTKRATIVCPRRSPCCGIATKLQTKRVAIVCPRRSPCCGIASTRQTKRVAIVCPRRSPCCGIAFMRKTKRVAIVCPRRLPCCGIAYCPLRPVTGMITSSICFLSCIAYPPLSTSFWRGIGVSRLCSCVLVKPSCQGFILLHLRL